MLLPEPFNGTGDISAYITQFELLSNLQSWLAPRKDADGNPELDGDGNQLYTDKRHQIFPLRLRAGAIEFYHSLDDETKNDYKSLRNAFEKQYLEPPEFLRGALRKRSQGESEKVTEFLADLKLLAKKAYPDDSEEIREHLVMQAFLEGLLDQNVRLEIRKEKDISLADALKKAVHLDAIYRLEIPSQGGVNNGLNNSPHGVGSIDRLINRMDSMRNKMAISQINSNSGRETLGDRVGHIKQTKILNRQDRGFLEINITLGRGTNEIKRTTPVPHHLHSVEILIRARLEDFSLIHLDHQASTDALILIKKLFAISATAKGTLKIIVATAGHVDLVLIQEETVHRQIRNKKK